MIKGELNTYMILHKYDGFINVKDTFNNSFDVYESKDPDFYNFLNKFDFNKKIPWYPAAATAIRNDFIDNDHANRLHDHVIIHLIPTMCKNYDKDSICKNIVRTARGSDLASPILQLFKFDTNIDLTNDMNYDTGAGIIISTSKSCFDDKEFHQIPLNIEYKVRSNSVIVSYIKYSAYERGRDITLSLDIETFYITK